VKSFSIVGGQEMELAARTNDWQTVPPSKAIEVVQALSSPVRAVINNNVKNQKYGPCYYS